MLDEQFLKILRDKLAKGSTSSVLLNCIPSTSLYKVDVTDLNSIEENLANDFVSKLLSEESFSFPISYQSISERDLTDERKIALERLSKKLNRVYNDNELSFQEKGHRTFGFGYPVFVIEIEDSWVRNKVGAKKKDKRILAAPLFLWSLEIHKSFKQSRTWHIKKSSDFSPILNDAFVSYIKQKHDVDLYQIIDLAPEEMLTFPKLERFTSEILNAINKYERNSVEIFSPDQLVVPLHEKKDLQEKASSNGFIEWSGVFSLYSKQKQNLINELDQLITQKDSFTLEDSHDEGGSPFLHSFSSLDTDHSQQNVINQLKSGTHFVIQGPPGTGKSQTLTALITNALSNGAKCLVVCEKNTALEVIFNNLKSIGLEDLCAFINDPTSKDRRTLVEKVRSTPLINHPSVSDYRFKNEVDDVNDRLAELSQGYGVLAKLVWEDQTWADMLGRYLRVKKRIPNNPLKQELKSLDWELSPEEYKKFRKVVGLAQKLKKKDSASFEIRLNSALFEDDRKGLVKEKLEDGIKDQLDSLKNLYSYWESLPQEYARDAEQYYQAIFANADTVVSEFTEKYDQLKKLSPELITLSPASFHDNLLKFSTLFSSKAKKARQYREDILKAYLDLKKFNQEKKLLTFHFLGDPEYLQLSLLHDNLIQFTENLEKFKTSVDDLISDSVESFLLKPEELPSFDPRRWEESQNKLEANISALNESDLFEEEFEFATQNNYHEQRSFLSDTITSLEKILADLTNFSAFYDYEKFYLNLNEREQDVVNIFIAEEFGEKLYEDIFDRFYLEQILLHNQSNDILKDGKKLELLYQKIEQLKKLVSQKIIAQFGSRQRANVKFFPGFKSLYNLRGSGGQRRNSLRQIVNYNFDFFTDFFPVILTNPTACSTLFPLKQDLFDVVIFDEASQLRLEDTFSSLLRGKTKIVSGDPHQMPPSRQYELTNISEEDDEYIDESEEAQRDLVKDNIIKSLANSESLLDYALTSGYKKTHLLVHYRSNHSALINFSNNAFYSGNLLPIIKKEDYVPITFYRVDGLYTERTNPAEADKAIEILSELVKPKEGICPSVGVATFNIHQRDLIYDKINQRSAVDPEFAEKMSMLQSKGFFVKNLENIQGDERDVIIMTTTFGKDSEGRFYKRFGPLGNKNGYRLLNVIITRAKNQFFVCTSIPENEILSFEERLKVTGKNDGIAIVFAYLAYAKAVSEGNQKQIEHILEVVKRGSTEEAISIPHFVETESPFEEEVYDELTRIVPDNSRIRSQVWIGSFRVDFLIDPTDDNRKPLVIECDGASYHGTSEAYAYDYFRMQQLRDNGYEVYRIWSGNWFDEKEYDEELEALRKVLKEYDDEVSVGSRFAKKVITKDEPAKINYQPTVETYFDEGDNSEEDRENQSHSNSYNENILDEGAQKSQNKDVNKNEELEAEYQRVATDQNFWFGLAHWGKKSGKFSSYQNRFAFSLGIYVSKHEKLTEKQFAAGYKLFATAKESGINLEQIKEKKT